MKVYLNLTMDFLRRNLWTFVFLFYQTFLVYFLAINAANGDVRERVLVNLLWTFLSIVSVSFLNTKLKNWFISIIYGISFIPNIVVLSFFLINNYIMKSTDFFVIFDTNPNEAFGFFDTLSLKIVVYVFIYIIIGLLLFLRALKTSGNNAKRYISIISLIFFLIISANLPFRSKVASIDFYKSFMNFNKEIMEIKEFYKNREHIKIDATSKLNVSPKNIILIIGESANRHHYSLYGYKRNTTPRLDSIKSELYIFKDVITPHIQTLNAIRYICTFSNHSAPKLYKKEPSIVEIFKAAGYKTYWIDNQGTGGIDTYTPTSYRAFAKLSDKFVLLPNGYNDEELLPILDSCLNESNENKFVVIHLKGSHFPYKDYPKEFKIFNSKENPSAFCKEMTDKDIENINNYDNTILYNDFIISSILKKVKSYSGLNLMLYTSDHGEEMYDTQLYAGRGFENITPSMCEVPFILYLNKAYKEILDTNSININRAFSTEDIPHSLLDICKIDYALKDSTRSIFNPNFVERERFVKEENYDDIRSKSPKL